MHTRVVSGLLLLSSIVLTAGVMTGGVTTTGVPAAVNPDTMNFEDLWKQGRAALAAGDLNAARQVTTNFACSAAAALSSPARAGLCEHEIGAVEYAAGNISEAEAHYKRALLAWQRAGVAFTPHHVITLTNLAQIYELQRRSADAECVC